MQWPGPALPGQPGPARWSSGRWPGSAVWPAGQQAAEGILTMWQAAWLVDDRSAPIAVATAESWAAGAGHRVAHTAVHVHGGMGIDGSYPLRRYFAVAKHRFALGRAITQLRRIGAEPARSGWPGHFPSR